MRLLLSKIGPFYIFPIIRIMLLLKFLWFTYFKLEKMLKRHLWRVVESHTESEEWLNPGSREGRGQNSPGTLAAGSRTLSTSVLPSQWPPVHSKSGKKLAPLILRVPSGPTNWHGHGSYSGNMVPVVGSLEFSGKEEYLDKYPRKYLEHIGKREGSCFVSNIHT